MNHSKKKYSKPIIKKEKVHINFFWDQSRFFDSITGLEGDLLAACPPSCGCFLPGTKITLSNGTHKPIESIKKTDKVISYDTTTKQIVENTVAKLLIHKNEESYFIINKNIFVTGNHRVWVNNSQWKRVDELNIGDTLLNFKSEFSTIESIERKKEKITVYNLHLTKSPHAFFAEDVLAHNNETWTEAEKTP